MERTIKMYACDCTHLYFSAQSPYSLRNNTNSKFVSNRDFFIYEFSMR